MNPEQWVPGAVEVSDDNWIVWFAVCPDPFERTAGIIWRCKRKRFDGPEDEGWIANTISNIALTTIAHKANLMTYVKQPLTKETLSQMTYSIETVLKVWAMNNKLGALIGKYESLYPSN
jgi:hypothetical protein